MFIVNQASTSPREPLKLLFSFQNWKHHRSLPQTTLWPWINKVSFVLFLTDISKAESSSKQMKELLGINSFLTPASFQSETPASLLNPQARCSQSLSPPFDHSPDYSRSVLSQWNLSRHFSHIRDLSASENLERFPKLMGNMKIFFSKKKKKKWLSQQSEFPHKS